MDRPRASPMFANLSGYLTALMYGFTGLQLGPGEPDDWSVHPVRLPEGWREIEIERVWVRGRAHALEARSGGVGARLTAA